MIRFAALLAVATLAALPGAANAKLRPGLDGEAGAVSPFQLAQARGEIPLPALIRMMERRTGGQFVNANPTEGPGGRPAYWMRFRFEGGRFADFIVDAQSGQILSGG